MSHIALHHAHATHPDPGRIIAISATISLNAAMLLLAMRPLAPHWRQVVTPPPLQVHFLHTAAPPKAAPVPPIQMPHRDVPRVTHSRPQPVPVATPTPVSTPVVHAPASTPTSTPAITPVRTAPTVTRTPLQHAQLAYRDAPAPAYPMQARHMHMQGTVVLRVLVDVHGNPSRVQVQDSSGWPLLDRVARLQVLRHWTFQPARVDGRTVRAWARVPVVFSLQRP